MTKHKTIIAANWKMNGSQALGQEILESLKSIAIKDTTEVIIFPPFVYLETFRAQKLFSYGAQNCHTAEKGAFTGEISASMLREFGCQYVIVGHCERRMYCQESDEIVAQKAKIAFDHGLVPIVCIGETLEQRQQHQTTSVLAKQLSPFLTQKAYQPILNKAMIAYEPIWAIGTNQPATPEIAQESHSNIRGILAQYDKQVADNIHLLYGGSVKAANASQLIKQTDINGFLIGGASLSPSEFTNILKVF